MPSEKTRDVVELAINDRANEMRDALHAAIHDKVADALQSRKIEIATSLIGQENSAEE